MKSTSGIAESRRKSEADKRDDGWRREVPYIAVARTSRVLSHKIRRSTVHALESNLPFEGYFFRALVPTVEARAPVMPITRVWRRNQRKWREEIQPSTERRTRSEVDKRPVSCISYDEPGSLLSSAPLGALEMPPAWTLKLLAKIANDDPPVASAQLRAGWLTCLWYCVGTSLEAP